MVSPGDIHDYRLTAAEPGAWLVSTARSRCRRSRPPTWRATAARCSRCQVQPLPPEVIPALNQAEGAVIAILHVTC
jgi:hypothetical protein